VDGTEAEQVDRYLKKANKETSFKKTCQQLGKTVRRATECGGVRARARLARPL